MWLKFTALSLLMGSLLLTGCQTLTPDRTRETASVEEMQRELDKVLAELAQQRTIVEPPPSVAAELLPALPVQADVIEQERFDISVEEVAARDFFVGLVKGTDLNIVVPPDLTGTLSLDLQNVTIDPRRATPPASAPSNRRDSPRPAHRRAHDQPPGIRSAH